jgi:hypothetical protein
LSLLAGNQPSRRRAAAGLGLVSVLWAALPGLSHAMFARLSDEELISRSELIVVGEWLGQSAVGAAALGERTPRLDLGAIAIAEVLKGPATQTVALVATPAANAANTARSGSDVAHKRGERGLWLLRAKPGAPAGIYLADHPQRFEADAARIEALRRLLKR